MGYFQNDIFGLLTYNLKLIDLGGNVMYTIFVYAV